MNTEEVVITQETTEVPEQTTAEAVETVSPQNDDVGSGNEDDNGNDDDHKQKRGGVEKRIGKLVGKLGEQGRKLTEKERLIEEQARTIAEFKAKYEQNNAPVNARPNISDPKWKSVEEYDNAVINWHQSQQQQTNQPRQAEQAPQIDPVQAEHNNKWAKEINEYAKINPEINDLADDYGYILENYPDIGFVLEKSYSPALIHHVVANKNEIIADLIGLDSYQIAIEMGKIAASLSKKTVTKKTTNAPAPITPVSGNGAKVAFDYEKASTEDFIKKRNEEERQRKFNRG